MRLTLHKDAAADLAELRISDVEAAAKLAALFQQINADPALLERLLEHQAWYEEVPPINVTKVASLYRYRDIWRFKSVVETKIRGFRIIYALDAYGECFHILGIARKDKYNYEVGDPLTGRFLAAYESLGLPVHRRL